MNIGYLLRYYPTLTETFIYSEIQGLLETGLNPTIIALGCREDGVLQTNLPKCSTHYVPRNRLQRLRSLSTRGEKWLLQYQRPKDAARLSSLRRQIQKLDHLHVHFAGEAAEMAYALHLDTGISYSVTTHAVDIFSPRKAWKEVLNNAHRVISISKYNQQYLQRNEIASELIYCGINLKMWPVHAPKDGPLKALFIGRDVPKKGLDVLLNAFSHFSSPHQLRVISNRSTESSNEVSFLPFLPYKEILKQLQWCNIVILPCQVADSGDRDGIPIVLMEALASGIPVISTDLPGITELINTNVGWLAKPSCVHSLYLCLQQATIFEQRRKRAILARAHIENSPFIQKQQIESLREQLITII